MDSRLRGIKRESSVGGGFYGNRLQLFGKEKFWWEIFSRTESYFSEKWIVSDENAKFQVFCTETHLG